MCGSELHRAVHTSAQASVFHKNPRGHIGDFFLDLCLIMSRRTLHLMLEEFLIIPKWQLY